MTCRCFFFMTKGDILVLLCWNLTLRNKLCLRIRIHQTTSTLLTTQTLEIVNFLINLSQLLIFLILFELKQLQIHSTPILNIQPWCIDFQIIFAYYCIIAIQYLHQGQLLLWHLLGHSKCSFQHHFDISGQRLVLRCLAIVSKLHIEFEFLNILLIY